MYPGANVPLGAECAGVITEIGAAVSEFKVGDRVLGFAPESLATEVTVPAAFLAPLPEAIDAEDAAGVPVAFLTAHYGLQSSRPATPWPTRAHSCRRRRRRACGRAIGCSAKVRRSSQLLVRPQSVNYCAHWVCACDGLPITGIRRSGSQCHRRQGR